MTDLLSRFIAGHPDDPGIQSLAALSVVAICVAVAMPMRSLRRMDELERQMHTEAMAFAFLGSILLVTTYWFLTLAELLTAPISWPTPAIVLCWVIGLLLAIVRYR